jgi:hypothetical protein
VRVLLFQRPYPASGWIGKFGALQTEPLGGVIWLKGVEKNGKDTNFQKEDLR